MNVQDLIASLEKVQRAFELASQAQSIRIERVQGINLPTNAVVEARVVPNPIVSEAALALEIEGEVHQAQLPRSLKAGQVIRLEILRADARHYHAQLLIEEQPAAGKNLEAKVFESILQVLQLDHEDLEALQDLRKPFEAVLEKIPKQIVDKFQGQEAPKLKIIESPDALRNVQRELKAYTETVLHEFEAVEIREFQLALQRELQGSAGTPNKAGKINDKSLSAALEKILPELARSGTALESQPKEIEHRLAGFIKTQLDFLKEIDNHLATILRSTERGPDTEAEAPTAERVKQRLQVIRESVNVVRINTVEKQTPLPAGVEKVLVELEQILPELESRADQPKEFLELSRPVLIKLKSAIEPSSRKEAPEAPRVKETLQVLIKQLDKELNAIALETGTKPADRELAPAERELLNVFKAIATRARESYSAASEKLAAFIKRHAQTAEDQSADIKNSLKAVDTQDPIEALRVQIERVEAQPSPPKVKELTRGLRELLRSPPPRFSDFMRGLEHLVIKIENDLPREEAAVLRPIEIQIKQLLSRPPAEVKKELGYIEAKAPILPPVRREFDALLDEIEHLEANDVSPRAKEFTSELREVLRAPPQRFSEITRALENLIAKIESDLPKDEAAIFRPLEIKIKQFVSHPEIETGASNLPPAMRELASIIEQLEHIDAKVASSAVKEITKEVRELLRVPPVRFAEFTRALEGLAAKIENDVPREEAVLLRPVSRALEVIATKIESDLPREEASVLRHVVNQVKQVPSRPESEVPDLGPAQREIVSVFKAIAARARESYSAASERLSAFINRHVAVTEDQAAQFQKVLHAAHKESTLALLRLQVDRVDTTIVHSDTELIKQFKDFVRGLRELLQTPPPRAEELTRAFDHALSRIQREFKTQSDAPTAPRSLPAPELNGEQAAALRSIEALLENLVTMPESDLEVERVRYVLQTQIKEFAALLRSEQNPDTDRYLKLLSNFSENLARSNDAQELRRVIEETLNAIKGITVFKQENADQSPAMTPEIRVALREIENALKLAVSEAKAGVQLPSLPIDKNVIQEFLKELSKLAPDAAADLRAELRDSPAFKLLRELSQQPSEIGRQIKEIVARLEILLQKPAITPAEYNTTLTDLSKLLDDVLRNSAAKEGSAPQPLPGNDLSFQQKKALHDVRQILTAAAADATLIAQTEPLRIVLENLQNAIDAPLQIETEPMVRETLRELKKLQDFIQLTARPGERGTIQALKPAVQNLIAELERFAPEYATPEIIDQLQQLLPPNTLSSPPRDTAALPLNFPVTPVDIAKLLKILNELETLNPQNPTYSEFEKQFIEFAQRFIHGNEESPFQTEGERRNVLRKALQHVRDEQTLKPERAAERQQLGDQMKMLRSLENFINGQEVLMRLTPLLQAAGEPVLMLFPAIFERFMTQIELIHYPNANCPGSDGGEKRRQRGKGGYARFEFQVRLPNLGAIQVDLAHHKKEEILMNLVCEREGAGEFLTQQFGKFEKSLLQAGFGSIQFQARHGKVKELKPRWFQELSRAPGVIA